MRWRVFASKRIAPGLSVGVSAPLRAHRGRRDSARANAEKSEALAATRPRGFWWVAGAAIATFVLMWVLIPLVVFEIPLMVATLVMLVRWLAKAGRYRLEKAAGELDR